jgi:hypothetical protein
MMAVVPRHFLLSPADCRGPRARMLLAATATFDLAGRLREPEGVPLGEVFAFLSALYFRGKLAYARAFARPERQLVIVPGEGLLRADTRVDRSRLLAFAEVPIEATNGRYVEPLARDARGLDGEVVLLGSIATGKYVDPLLAILGERLLFPSAFVGRGDMSRGGLLLRAVDDGRELDYVRVRGAVRHGVRPPRLRPRPRPLGG